MLGGAPRKLAEDELETADSRAALRIESGDGARRLAGDAIRVCGEADDGIEG